MQLLCYTLFLRNIWMYERIESILDIISKTIYIFGYHERALTADVLRYYNEYGNLAYN